MCREFREIRKPSLLRSLRIVSKLAGCKKPEERSETEAEGFRQRNFMCQLKGPQKRKPERHKVY
jgi:hypothetical protein